MKRKIINIRYPLAIDKGLGTLVEENDLGKHIEQMMMQVLFTSPGERINRSDFGCGLRQMVFAPNNEVSANLTQVMVLQALEKWLSDLITVSDVNVKAINERLEIVIVYLIKAKQERRYLNLEVPL